MRYLKLDQSVKPSNNMRKAFLNFLSDNKEDPTRIIGGVISEENFTLLQKEPFFFASTRTWQVRWAYPSSRADDKVWPKSTVQILMWHHPICCGTSILEEDHALQQPARLETSGTQNWLKFSDLESRNGKCLMTTFSWGWKRPSTGKKMRQSSNMRLQCRWLHEPVTVLWALGEHYPIVLSYVKEGRYPLRQALK